MSIIDTSKFQPLTFHSSTEPVTTTFVRFYPSINSVNMDLFLYEGCRFEFQCDSATTKMHTEISDNVIKIIDIITLPDYQRHGFAKSIIKDFFRTIVHLYKFCPIDKVKGELTSNDLVHKPFLIHFYSRFNDYVSEEFLPLELAPYVKGADSFEKLLEHKTDYEHTSVYFGYKIKLY